MTKLTYNIKQYKVKPTSKGGYILTNDNEDLMIHKSLLATSSNKYAPYCLKDRKTGKHLTGMFVETLTPIPVFYYLDDSNEYKYTIKVDEQHEKAILTKDKNTKKH